MASGQPSTAAAVERALATVVELANRAADSSDDMGEELAGALDALRRAVIGAQPRKKNVQLRGLPSYASVVGEQLRSLRDEAGLTQRQLAEAMSRAGFDWKRVTVAQLESATRRLSLEEQIVLCALYAIPVVELLAPAGEVVLTIKDGLVELSGDELRELFMGPSGVPGSGGLSWALATRVTGTALDADDIRPAVSLWNSRDPEVS